MAARYYNDTSYEAQVDERHENNTIAVCGILSDSQKNFLT